MRRFKQIDVFNLLITWFSKQTFRFLQDKRKLAMLIKLIMAVIPLQYVWVTQPLCILEYYNIMNKVLLLSIKLK
jgi:hypothetical protein